MENDPDLDLAASATVTELLEALQAGDVAKYRSLMSDSDQELMSQEELSQAGKVERCCRNQHRELERQ